MLTVRIYALEESWHVLSTLDPPSAPVTGWEAVTKSNAKQIAKKMPCVTAGTLYAYLSGRNSSEFSRLKY